MAPATMALRDFCGTRSHFVLLSPARSRILQPTPASVTNTLRAPKYIEAPLIGLAPSRRLFRHDASQSSTYDIGVRCVVCRLRERCCRSGGRRRSKRAAGRAAQTLCDLLPRADAEKIMGKALVQRRNDASGCHYEDARGTTGTGLWIYLNAFEVRDQCRLTPRSEPVSGVGSEACIAIGHPAGLYTTVVFKGGGRTFEATAPGQDRTSELATPVARAVLSKLGD